VKVHAGELPLPGTGKGATRNRREHSWFCPSFGTLASRVTDWLSLANRKYLAEHPTLVTAVNFGFMYDPA
jgi:hypothetical protein